MTTTSTLQTKLFELPLGQAGLDYVRANLKNETTFCQKVTPIAAEGGSVYAVVPEGTDLARALQFDYGGLVGTRWTNRWLLDHMLAVCKAQAQGVLIFDEPWGGRKGDPAVMQRP